MRDKQIIYRNKWLPFFLILPELLIILVFFFWPAFQAFNQSFLIEDPFGLSSRFVWFENYTSVLSDPFYLNTLRTTFLLSFWITLASMVSGLALAWLVFQLKRREVYQTLIIWPYALAPPPWRELSGSSSLTRPWSPAMDPVPARACLGSGSGGKTGRAHGHHCPFLEADKL